MQGLFITDVGSFGGLQARNVVAYNISVSDPFANILLRNETAAACLMPAQLAQ